LSRWAVRKPGNTIFKRDGLEMHQVCGPYAELYFDWNLLPDLDLAKQYYIVEITPSSSLLPVEIARPNSEGPLHFCLKTGVEYQLRLLSVLHLSFEIISELDPLPHVDLILQHENRVKLIWGDIDVQTLKKVCGEKPVEIFQDGVLNQQCHLTSWVTSELVGRPEVIKLSCGEHQLLEISTNLQQMLPVKTLKFQLEEEPIRLMFSKVVTPIPDWRVRAELTPTFQIRNTWQKQFVNGVTDGNPEHAIGCFRFFENGEQVAEIRQWGFSTKVQYHLVDQIQRLEWNLKKPEPVRRYKLQLQITSPHRELFKFVLLEKQLEIFSTDSPIGFSEQELMLAEQLLFETNRHVSWDQSFLELVLWFEVDGHDWQEFQRDIAHSMRWDYLPSPAATECYCEWILFDLSEPDRWVRVFTSGAETRIKWPPRVYLKPFSQKRVFVCWDLDQRDVEKVIGDRWEIGLEEVGFFLKVHEEYLGDRIRRPDLDIPVTDLFPEHQDRYIDVEPDKSLSVEMIARHHQQELALTPVSMPIITPRITDSAMAVCTSYARVEKSSYHSSQREVRHLHGKDAGNRARVLLHLHMHSPNLHRLEPFRESFLRDGTWPLLTVEGAEVHNPPGEWVLKNCLDSWLPLLRIFRKLAFEQVDFQVSLDISPPVAYMISSSWFKDYMSRYLLRVKAYVDGQIAQMRFRNDSAVFIHAAEHYRKSVDAIESFYVDELQKDMIGAFRDLELKGFLEISTCTATHGMPAELESVPDALNNQITLAARSHHRIFGDRPRGIWLAENSFFPGVEGLLDKEALAYFFVEAEAVLSASERPIEEEYSPIVLPGGNVVAFGRSRLGRTQVWDADIGYAGHPEFREYHFRHLGLPVKRITSKTSDNKQPYDPSKAEQIARELAQDFYGKLSDTATELGKRDHKSIPLITCSYDAELFGHHWWEGPAFLEELLREFYRRGDTVGLTTPSHYLVDLPVLPRTVPNPSTWGHDALHVKWSDPKVAWTFREIERAEWTLRSYLVKGLENQLTDFQVRAVEQMGAEFIRAQSSDLTFVIMAGDFEEDMQREILKFLDYFYKLKALVDNQIEDEWFLRFRLSENDMFPEFPQYYAIRSESSHSD